MSTRSQRATLAMIVGLVVFGLASPVAAQRAHIQISAGPYYRGEPVDIHLVVEDFDEGPTPTVDVSPPGDARLDFAGVNPSTRSSISIVNGRMTQTKEVRFVFQYRFVANKAGRFSVGPFRVEQDGVQRTTGPIHVDVEALGNSDRVEISASWPRRDVYPGQRIPIKVEWSFESTLNDRMQDYRIEIPLFERTDLFRFIDTPPQQGDTQMIIRTGGSNIALKADVTERREGGRIFKVVTAERIAIPLQHGEFRFPGPTAVIDEVVRWRRDLFGQRTPQGSRKIASEGDARSLVVRDVPRDGRPDSYVGAIGHGFSLEVTADRSVMQVGDPIELTLVLRGDGNLEGAGLPNLAANGGLSPDLFRIPTGSQAGELEDGAKSFRIQVRVLDASVREIPPIAFSYFDPDKREFVAVASRPIALSVRRAQVITSADVVSGAVPSSRGEVEVGRETENEQAPDDGVRSGDRRTATGEWVLSGANLSIVRDPEDLVGRGGRSGFGSVGVVALYLASLVAVAIALLYRSRKNVDPLVANRRKLYGAQRKAIEGARGKATSEAMSIFSVALRAMLQATPGARSVELDNFLSRCDAISYAPSGSSSGVVEGEVVEQALALAHSIEEAAQ